ncbi:hypothetical protein ACM43_05520 [Bradyrhizobium sp. CCBAU 45321]|nr:hypothetical protein [Bradyrhizobium sp. CCBAU 45321]
MVMMADLVAMSVAMTTLRQRGARQCEAGRNDQRGGERKFLHDVLQWASAFVRSVNERWESKFPANVEES